jgi:hypothetical protein
MRPHAAELPSQQRLAFVRVVETDIAGTMKPGSLSGMRLLVVLASLIAQVNGNLRFRNQLAPRDPKCSIDSCMSTMSRYVSTPLAHFCTLYDLGSMAPPAAAATFCSPITPNVSSICSCITSTPMVPMTASSTAVLSTQGRPTFGPVSPPTSAQSGSATSIQPSPSDATSAPPQLPCGVTTVTQISVSE